MKFEILKNISQLNIHDLDLIFNSAYPKIPKIIDDSIISHEINVGAIKIVTT